jgi:hypothetical protein
MDMSSAYFPCVFTAPTIPGALPCFSAQDLERAGRRPLWDSRCAELLKSLADRHTNAELADLIAAQIGMRFKVKTISDRRAALGLEAPRFNGWSAPLTRTRMIRLGRR